MMQVLIDNRDGNVWDVSDIAGDMSWKTSRIGKAGSLDFTLLKGGLYESERYKYRNGDIVQVTKDGHPVFYGYIFSVDGGSGETVKLKAYDQIRYLMNTDTFVFQDRRASDMITLIAEKFRLRTGYIADTSYVIPQMAEDGKKLLDICDKALTLTLVHTGRNFMLYDDFGYLALRNVEDMLLDFYVGEESLLTDYSLSTSIDEDTYNRIVLYQDNKKSGKRELHVAEDSANKAQWGVLQLYQSVGEEMSVAAIRSRLDNLATLKNRETRKLKLNALGDIRVRAGSYIRVWLKEEGIHQPFLVDECTHKFDGALHTMTLELKVIP
ncbi:XkdQ/YqbQ family protein [Paenibacillus chungangensis]|uniref:YqbQ/XkdQ domain-containing protein n=1 Tax=Paenibacillus chungangensis TaxID=696535 RepID=A0ABW3HQP7_9BACL